jgi:hypothetical protein
VTEPCPGGRHAAYMTKPKASKMTSTAALLIGWL